MTIWLESAFGTAAIDPERGCDVLHFGRTARAEDNVLAAYDWLAPVPARAGTGYGNSTLDWLSEYRGGWQLLTPNAGAASTVRGMEHPFHGEVSRARWHVDRTSAESLSATTATHGPLSVRRTIALDDEQARITATTTLSNDTPVTGYAVLVEHIAFRGSDDSRLRAPAGSLWRHDPASPEVVRAMETMTWRHAALAEPRSRGGCRLASLVAGSEGWMELGGGHDGTVGIRVEWDPVRMPFAWHWQERGSEGFPWFGRADITAIEPASASFSDGLAAAIERGEAWAVAPGQTIETAVSIMIEGEDG